MDPNIKYLCVHSEITKKLSKKLFRKPDFDEVGKDFLLIADCIKKNECPEYAAVFYESSGRCESIVKNHWRSSAHLMAAAENYMEAENNLELGNFISVPQYLEEAKALYNKAAQTFLDKGMIPMACNIYIYAADMCYIKMEYNEALVFLRKASDIVPRDPYMTVFIYQKSLVLLIMLNDFVGALATAHKMQRIIFRESVKGEDFGPFEDAVVECEIYKVLLTLQCSAMKSVVGDDKKVNSLEQYSSDELDAYKNTPLKNEELFLLLQSLIISYEESVQSELELVATHLADHLDEFQMSLLTRIIDRANLEAETHCIQ